MSRSKSVMNMMVMCFGVVAIVAIILGVIVGAVCAGNAGDGKIWISPIEEVIRVRTGTVGEGALQ